MPTGTSGRVRIRGYRLTEQFGVSGREVDLIVDAIASEVDGFHGFCAVDIILQGNNCLHCQSRTPVPVHPVTKAQDSRESSVGGGGLAAVGSWWLFRKVMRDEWNPTRVFRLLPPSPDGPFFGERVEVRGSAFP